MHANRLLNQRHAIVTLSRLSDFGIEQDYYSPVVVKTGRDTQVFPLLVNQKRPMFLVTPQAVGNIGARDGRNHAG